VFVQDASRRRFRAALNALNAHSDSATVSLNIVRQGARIVAGGAAPGVQLDVTDVVLGDALRAVAAMAAPQAASRNVTLAVEHASASILARADSERLSQILLNLVGNAIKFTPPGGRIAISSRATTTDAIVEIADTGLGIPEEKREEIFKPFSRLRTSTAPGTGLGLAISRDLARVMGGDITVTNADEVGSRFVLRLPRSTRFAVEPDLG
jgi:signal transduction histidine kinase